LHGAIVFGEETIAVILGKVVPPELLGVAQADSLHKPIDVASPIRGIVKIATWNVSETPWKEDIVIVDIRQKGIWRALVVRLNHTPSMIYREIGELNFVPTNNAKEMIRKKVKPRTSRESLPVFPF